MERYLRYLRKDSEVQKKMLAQEYELKKQEVKQVDTQKPVLVEEAIKQVVPVVEKGKKQVIFKTKSWGGEAGYQASCYPEAWVKQVVTQKLGSVEQEVNQMVTQKLGLVDQEVNQIGTQKPGVALMDLQEEDNETTLASGQCASCLRYIQYHTCKLIYLKRFRFSR